MPFSLNFILPHEARSATPIPFKTLGLALTILLVGIFALNLALKSIRAADLEKQLRVLESSRQELQRREAAERAQEPHDAVALDHAREFDYWFENRPRWSVFLHRIARETPAEIQLQQLTVDSNRDANNDTIRRQAQMVFQARVAGHNPEPIIKRFQTAIEARTGAAETPIENYRPLPSANPDVPEHAFRISIRFPLSEPNP